MNTMIKSLNLLITIILFLANDTLVKAQIWDLQSISFPKPSEAGRVKPVDANIAVTFGNTIESDPEYNYKYTRSVNTIQRTLNGGSSWETIEFKSFEEGGGHICDVFAIDKNKIFISYYDSDLGPVLYSTFDGGNIWKKASYGLASYLNWVYFFDELNGVGFGDPDDNNYFEIITSSDGGNSWTKNSNQQSIKAIGEYGIEGEFTYYENHIWTRTTEKRIFHSSDKGLNWEVINGPSNEHGSMKLNCDKDLNLYAAYTYFDVDGFSIFSKGKDDVLWKAITPLDSIGFISGFEVIPGTNHILFNSGMRGVPNSFKTFTSVDKGKSWKIVADNEGLQFGDIDFVSPQTGYCNELLNSFELPSTHVFKYNGSPLSGLLGQEALKAIITLNPNPCTSNLLINMTSEDSNDYWVLINNEIGVLMSKSSHLKTNNLQQNIDISNWPKGIYTVSIASNTGVSSEKIVKQ